MGPQHGNIVTLALFNISSISASIRDSVMDIKQNSPIILADKFYLHIYFKKKIFLWYLFYAICLLLFQSNSLLYLLSYLVVIPFSSHTGTFLIRDLQTRIFVAKSCVSMFCTCHLSFCTYINIIANCCFSNYQLQFHSSNAN